jgi:hypothetical protein
MMLTHNVQGGNAQEAVTFVLICQKREGLARLGSEGNKSLSWRRSLASASPSLQQSACAVASLILAFYLHFQTADSASCILSTANSQLVCIHSFDIERSTSADPTCASAISH